MSTVIQVENLSKQYRLGQVGRSTLADDLNRLWCRLRGKEDPFLKIGQTNDRTQKPESGNGKPGKKSLLSAIKSAAFESPELVWALKDVNFEVKEGEVLGIIGRNGAGKSTLLKILSRVTTPTTGHVRAKGRIASLLEVGTGFHPDLSGRENIYLNGAILGMRKQEITRKLDEIIEFSGCDRYIDTPVKRYSSGMYVRLAFAVAAHLEPEILIVDEVLAVGDQRFQQKCLGKMSEVASRGRTVLVVSHNMAVIQGLCSRCLLLDNGRMSFAGTPAQAVKHYLEASTRSHYGELKLEAGPPPCLTGGRIMHVDGRVTAELLMGESFILEVDVLEGTSAQSPVVGFAIENQQATRICGFHTEMKKPIKTKAEGAKCCTRFFVQNVPLTPGTYSVNLSLTDGLHEYIQRIEHCMTFDVVTSDIYESGFNVTSEYGAVFAEVDWEKTNL